MEQIDFNKKIHPEHLKYLVENKEIKLAYFFEIISTFDPIIRDKIFERVNDNVFNIRLGFPHTLEQLPPIFASYKYSYKVFAKRVIRMSKYVSEPFLVFSMVSYILKFLLDLDESVFLRNAYSPQSLWKAYIQPSR